MPEIVHVKMNTASTAVRAVKSADPVTSDRPPESEIERVALRSPEFRAQARRFPDDDAEPERAVLRRGYPGKTHHRQYCEERKTNRVFSF